MADRAGGGAGRIRMAMRDGDLAKALPRSALLVTGIVYIFGAWKCALGLHALARTG